MSAEPIRFSSCFYLPAGRDQPALRTQSKPDARACRMRRSLEARCSPSSGG